MAKGFTSDGVDFDDLFDPDVVGDGPAATWLTDGGVPLRYARLAYGSKRADVGFTDGGVDVSNLWAAKGTAQYVIAGLHGKHLSAEGQAPTSGSTASATVSVSINGNGTWSVAGATNTGSAPQAEPTSGTWLMPGRSAGDFDLRLRVTSSGDAVASNSAPDWRFASQGGGASISVSVSGATQDVRAASMSVLIDLRDRATGVVTTTAMGGTVRATGFV